MSGKGIEQLATFLAAAKQACDEVFAKLTPEQKSRICDNILAKVKERRMQKLKGGAQ